MTNDEPIDAAEAWKIFRDRDQTLPSKDSKILWESMWRAFDFSWEGLRNANWEGQDPDSRWRTIKRWRAPADFPKDSPIEQSGAFVWKKATLQDYWRWVSFDLLRTLEDAEEEVSTQTKADLSWSDGRLASDAELLKLGLLIEVDGVLWHAVHHPEVVVSQLDATFCNEINDQDVSCAESGHSHRHGSALWEALFCRLKLSNPEQPLDLTGARALEIDSCIQSYHSSTLSNDEMRIWLSASFSALSGVRFNGISFGDWCNISYALITKRSRFVGASFGDRANFSGSIFGERTDFSKATFGYHASFFNCAFDPSAQFQDVVFRRLADFSSASFGSGAFFRRAVFADQALFRNAIFGPGLSARRAAFGGESDFSGARFEERADFEACQFGDRANFSGASFMGMVSFEEAKFNGSLRAEKVIFWGRLSMKAAEISGYADFSNVVWPDVIEDQQSAFEGCRLRDVANFQTPDFVAFSIFDGVDITGRLLLREPPVHASGPDELFAIALQKTADAVREDRRRVRRGTRKVYSGSDAKHKAVETIQELESKGTMGGDARFGALESGLRTLKLSMARQSDYLREQRFYRFELKARSKKPSEPRLAKVAASAYGLAADYGWSIGRPFVSIALILFVFSAAYFVIGFWNDALGSKVGESGWQAFEFSWNNVFKPLSALSPEGVQREERTLAATLLYERGGAVAAGVRALATLQSLMAIILAFLFALAVRRRFQIS